MFAIPQLSPMYVYVCGNLQNWSLYPHTLMYCHGTWTQWSLDTMWPQQTWGQRSCRGQWPLVQVFGKKDQCIHIPWCIFKSNITMIAKVCARESRRDSWFENRLVCNTSSEGGGGCCNPHPGFSIFNALYPYIYYQCIAMGLFFPLIPKRYHPSSYDVTMASYSEGAIEILAIFTITDKIQKE